MWPHASLAVMGGALRVWLLGLLCAGVWALSGQGPFDVAGQDAPSTEFSASRAGAMLARLLGPQHPHPAGSAEDAGTHGRVLAELARLGVSFHTITGMSCAGRGAVISCATVSDIVAEVLPGPTTGDKRKAILLMAHLDSVAAGPGAADDASGVATILETIRALKSAAPADPQNNHPVIALFSDGEEAGLLGANLFLNDRGWRDRVGMVVNAEARGNQGPSYLFQTSTGNSKLVDLYARSVAHPATSSLYGEIYKYLPNDTDLTPFLQAGFPGANFAFIGDVAAYHTSLDRLENLSPATLQSQGDNVLGLTRGLLNADFATLKSGDAIDLDIGRRWLPRLPASLALPLAVTAFILIVLAAWFSPRGRPQPRRPLAEILMPPLLLAGCIAAGFALSGVATLISGNGDPAFAHPLALRIGLGFAAWAMALLTMRSAGVMACWLWFALLGIIAAIFAPGFSPYFIFPGLVAALLLLLTPDTGRGTALFLAAVAAMIVWLGLAANGEAIMGLAGHPLLMLAAAMALTALLPVLAAQKMDEGVWRASIILSLTIALAAAVVQGLQPAASASQPLRLNLRYVEKDGKAWMLADPVSHLPESLRAAATFSLTPQPLAGFRGYVAPMGNVQFPAPSATVAHRDNSVALDLHGSDAAGGMVLVVPSGLHDISIGDVHLPASGVVTIRCGTADCAHAPLVLNFSGPAPDSLLLMEQRPGLPPNAAAEARARPDWAVPSGQGDMSFVATDVPIP
jgi:hypothetical protein